MAGTPEQNRSAFLSKQLGKLTQQTNAGAYIEHSLLVVIYYVQLGSKNVTDGFKCLPQCTFEAQI